MLVLKIHTLQATTNQIGQCRFTQTRLATTNHHPKRRSLYQLAASWLDVSDELQQLNYDYLNARIMPEDYAFQLDHLLEEPILI